MCRVPLSLLQLAVVAVMGCTDTVRAPVTIVVDTDLARARDEQVRPEARREAVPVGHAELDAARAEVERGPLEARAHAPAVGPDVATAVAAGSEAGVARVTAQRGSDATAAPATTSSSTSTTAAEPSADAVVMARARIGAVRTTLRARQMELADVDGAVVLADRIEGLAGRGDGALALALAGTLEEKIRTVVVDRALLLRRYERLNTRARQAELDGPRRQRIGAGLGEASAAISRGDHPGALTALADVAGVLDAP
jgi:hypothetical protein